MRTDPISQPVSDPSPRLVAEKTRESLAGLLGSEAGRRAWREACSVAGFSDDEPMSLDGLEAVAEHLSEQDGLVGLAGNSMSIRIRTYRMLERNHLLEKFLDRQDVLDERQRRIGS